MHLSWSKSWRPGILNKTLHFPLLKGVAGTAQAKVFQKSFYHALSVLWYGDTKPKLGLTPNLQIFWTWVFGFRRDLRALKGFKDTFTQLWKIWCFNWFQHYKGTNIEPPKIFLDARPLKSYILVSPKRERIVGFSSMAFRGGVVKLPVTEYFFTCAFPGGHPACLAKEHGRSIDMSLHMVLTWYMTHVSVCEENWQYKQNNYTTTQGNTAIHLRVWEENNTMWQTVPT